VVENIGEAKFVQRSGCGERITAIDKAIHLLGSESASRSVLPKDSEEKTGLAPDVALQAKDFLSKLLEGTCSGGWHGKLAAC